MSSQSPTSRLADGSETAPLPGKKIPAWKTGILKYLGEQPEARWGTQLIRIARDMILVVDEDLRIQFHNQGLVRGLGFSEGSYQGDSLLSFFPADDRESAKRAFDTLRTGRNRGIAVEATFLGKSKPVLFAAEVMRSLSKNGSYFYYIVARPRLAAMPGRAAISSQTHVVGSQATAAVALSAAPSADTATSFLDLLPVAAWRGDKNKRLVELGGQLWDDMGVDRSAARGAELAVAKSANLPEVMSALKPSLRSALRSSETTIDFAGKRYDVTVEPVRGAGGDYQGSIGFLRLALSVATPSLDSGPVASNRTTTVLLNPNLQAPVADGVGPAKPVAPPKVKVARPAADLSVPKPTGVEVPLPGDSPRIEFNAPPTVRRNEAATVPLTSAPVAARQTQVLNPTSSPASPPPAVSRNAEMKKTAVVPVQPVPLTPPPFRASDVEVEIDTTRIGVRSVQVVASDVALPS